MNLSLVGVQQPAPAGVAEGDFTSYALVSSFPISGVGLLTTSSNAYAVDEVNELVYVHEAGDVNAIIDIGAATIAAIADSEDAATFNWARMNSIFCRYFAIRTTDVAGDRITIFKNGSILQEIVETPGTNLFVNPLFSWSGRFLVFPDITEEEWQVFEGA